MTAIDLQRAFVPLKPDGETIDWGVEMGRRYGGWLGWDELITRQRIVLLAEANSGKTEEFRLRTAMLRERDKAGFFLRVEDLADGPLLDGLSPDDAARFAAWHDSDEPGWFFLDSVDEARLNAKSFERALNRFRREIGPALDRAFVFISCRVSDWKGKQDLDLVATSLPVSSRRALPVEASSVDELLLRPILKDDSPPARDENGSDANESLTIVRLAELTTEQRSALARWAGVADTEPFIREINRQGLNTLAERPGDLLELAEYWKAHGKFASFGEMTEFAIVQKLAERDTHRRDAGILTDIRAREGTERIAAALTLGKSLTLRVPGQEPDPTLAAGALDPADILLDWTPLERAALLRRGVFTPATYGRVRFHHRSTQEYLTAKWLRRMLESGCPRSEVMALLFADPYGVRTAVPSMRPAAAWLALHDTEIREELLDREPLELMRHGDPRSLPIGARARLLVVYADRQSAGEVTNDSVDHRSLWMFADTQLAPAIREAWARNTDPSFRTDLVLLVREGVIVDCVDLAREQAANSDAHSYFRYAAVDAMTACEDREGLAHFVDGLMVNPSALLEGEAANFARRLYPKYLSRSDLIRLIDESQPAQGIGVEGFPDYIRDFWAQCPRAERVAFLEELADLCRRPPFRSSYDRVSARHRRLAPKLALPAADVARCLENRPAPLGLIKACAAIERSEESQNRDDLLRLHDALQGQQREFHRDLFWFDVQEARRNREPDVTHWWQLVHGSHLWALTVDDAEWLMGRVRDEVALQDRQIALSVLISILGEEGLRVREGELRPSVDGVPELERALAAALSPRPPDAGAKRLARRERIWARQKKKREAKTAQTWINFAARIRGDTSHLRDPLKLSDWACSCDLLTLTEWLSRRTGKSRQDAARSWPLLGDVFGNEVAQAYRVGMKLLWRLTVPRTGSGQGSEPNKVEWTDRLSFYGVGLESDEEGWAERLTGDEAERAALHAIAADEPSPDWVEVLACTHPHRVAPIIAREVAAEWRATSAVPSNFVDRIADGGDEYVLQMADLVTDCLGERPGRLHTFDVALRALARLPLTTPVRAKLIARAQHELHTNVTDTDNDWRLRQLALLFICDPEIGLESLEDWLGAADSDEDRKARSERAFSGLFSRHWPLVPDRVSGQPVQTLKRLALLAYRTIRIEDDEHHEGVYSPGLRDEAESARSRILDTLLEIPGRDTYEALCELANEPSIASRRKRFRELAHRRAEDDSELAAWTAADVVAFENRHAAPAKSGRDLFRIAGAILDDIQTGFLHDDASSRLVLGSAKDEQAVQQWLAEQFKLRSKHRFHVYREVEVARKKEPDIVLASTSAAVEVAVEVKHSNKGWTIRDLEGALRDQLARDYLRPSNRRYGLLVITHHGERTWRDPDTNDSLDFEHLLGRLRDLAATLQHNETGSIELAVVGLDACPRG